MNMRVGSRYLGAFAAFLSVTAPAFAQGKHYIALGDSYPLGYTTSAAPPTNGDTGYVGLYADFLATLNNGIRPTLVNTSVSGDTTTSFTTGTTSLITDTPANLFDAPLRDQARNTNYSVAPTPQLNFFNDAVDNILNNGGTVDYITLQIGGNDFIGLLAQDNFRNVFTPDQQQAVLAQQFTALGNNYTAILTAIRTKVPTARVFTIGYADVFAGLGALNPVPQSGLLTANANAIIQGVSQSLGATYVDISAPFAGNELLYTRIGTLDGGFPNVHPTPLGHQVIAAQLITASAPEPGTFALLLPIAAGVIALRRRTH
ncbi:MAG: hypothetical protein OHK0029_19230 [Armatimonadaceae bacterium]